MLSYRFNVPEKKPRPRTLPVTITQPEVEYPGIRQPDMAAAESQEIEMTTKKKVAGNGVGVIDSIVEVISRERGGTIPEIVAILSKRFPDRDEAGMTATARIQANRNATHKERDEKRGLVYFRRGRAAR